MATTQRANHEPAHRANQCRCHQPARGHFWDPVTLRCTNGSCTRTWDGQQVSPTDCEGPDQQAYGARPGDNMPKRQPNQLYGGLSQRLLRDKIIPLTLLGLLTAALAGWIGGPLALDGRGCWRKLGGWLIVGFGCLGSVVHWSWGILGYPFAFVDWGAGFGRTAWRLLLGV